MNAGDGWYVQCQPAARTDGTSTRREHEEPPIMTPTDTEHVASTSGSLAVSLLLAACDEELQNARRIGAATAKHHDTWGQRHEADLDSAYSLPGFACSGREALEIIVGDGLHAPGASTAVRIKYDGWATIAEQEGDPDLARALREYVRSHRRGGGLLVSDAIAYLEGARRVIAEA
jgi:hypothetical protein